jgi:hypothetical protein
MLYRKLSPGESGELQAVATMVVRDPVSERGSGFCGQAIGDALGLRDPVWESAFFHNPGRPCRGCEDTNEGKTKSK